MQRAADLVRADLVIALVIRSVIPCRVSDSVEGELTSPRYCADAEGPMNLVLPSACIISVPELSSGLVWARETSGCVGGGLKSSPILCCGQSEGIEDCNVSENPEDSVNEMGCSWA